MDMKGYPETSVTNYQSTLRDVTEEQQSHLHRSRRKPQITHLHTCLCVHSIIQILNPKLGYTSRGQLKCDGTRAETRFRLSAKRTSPFKSTVGGRQFSRLLAAEVCASAVVMLDTPCSEVVWRVLATHCIRQFPPSLLLPCVTVCHHISTWLYNYMFRLFTIAIFRLYMNP